ncbi:MAG: hypothetical protein IJI98_08265 [Methanosphaera sp.]|nr:hypothetical protein [Methanosphaera sp.]
MDNKKKIMIIVLLLIIAGIILVMLTYVRYDKIEITPNGTTIDVPAEQTKYQGDFNKIKLWKWDKGFVISYNSYEENSLINVGEMSFNALNDLIKKGTSQNIDGLTCYVINADDLFQIQLFDFIKLNYKGKFYCIPLSNDTTHDNIIIFAQDKDIALHMAKSVEYKKVYTDKPKNDTISNIENITNDLKNKTISTGAEKVGDAKAKIENMASDIKNNPNLPSAEKLRDTKSNVENIAENWKSKVQSYTDKIPNF